MYSQALIDSYGMNYFDNIVKNNFVFDFNNNSFKNIRLMQAFEHYLVKGIMENINKDYCIYHIKKLYNIFFSKPYLFADSLLIRNRVVDLVLSGEELKRFKEFRGKYFNVDLENMFNNISKLSDEDKNRFYASLLVYLRNGDNQKKKLFEKVITDIINKHKTINTMNEMELKFYCQYVSNFALHGEKSNSIVCIGEESSSLRGEQSNGLICINKKSGTPSIELVTKTVCHETRHFIQEIESKNKVNVTAFEMAQFELFYKYLNSTTYNSYRENYKYATIELDAETHGHFDAGVFFHMFHRVDLADRVSENRREHLDKRDYYKFMKDKDGKVFCVDRFIVENMDKIMREHPEELNNYPVLREIYNSNGERKSFGDILYYRMTEKLDNRGVVDNYINYGIVHGQLDTINLTRVSKENIKGLFKSLSIVLRDTVHTLENYFRDTPNINMKGQVRTVTLYQMEIINCILKYVEFNSISLYDSIDEDLNNQSLPFDFIVYLRDFNFSIIKNECLKDDPVVRDRMNNIMSTVNELVREFNKKYLASRLCRLSSEQLGRCYPRSDMTFETYMFNVVLPKMNSHLEVEINGKLYYVGDIIRNYSKMTEQEINQTVDKLQV